MPNNSIREEIAVDESDMCVCRESDQRGSRGYPWRRRRRRLVSLKSCGHFEKTDEKFDSIRVSFFQLQYLSDGLLDRKGDFQYTNALTVCTVFFFFFFFVADFRKSDRIFCLESNGGF